MPVQASVAGLCFRSWQGRLAMCWDSWQESVVKIVGLSRVGEPDLASGEPVLPVFAVSCQGRLAPYS